MFVPTSSSRLWRRSSAWAGHKRVNIFAYLHIFDFKAFFEFDHWNLLRATYETPEDEQHHSTGDLDDEDNQYDAEEL